MLNSVQDVMCSKIDCDFFVFIINKIKNKPCPQLSDICHLSNIDKADNVQIDLKT